MNQEQCALTEQLPNYIQQTGKKLTLNLSTFMPKLLDKDTKTIVDFLNSRMAIKSLNLSGHSIGVKGAKELAQLKHIKHLDLSSNNLGDLGVKTITESLSQLSFLDVQANELTVSSAKALSRLGQFRLKAFSISYAVGQDVQLEQEAAETINALLKQTAFNSNRHGV